jgi:septum site-determining protein MinC
MSQAAELRFVQLGALALRVHELDGQAVEQELQRRREQAPELLAGARLVLDVSRLDEADCSRPELDELVATLARSGFPLVGLITDQPGRGLSTRLGLPLMGPAGTMRNLASESQPPDQPDVVGARPSMLIERQIRSGQQVYARHTDLVINGSVSAGAEVIADGSIHVYGALRGRALAGADGSEQARIYSLDFQAELVSVAGHYKVFEELPTKLRGERVQVWLNEGQLALGKLG